MPSDIPAPLYGDAFKMGPLLRALVVAPDWRACCAQLTSLFPQFMPGMRLDIYVENADGRLDLAFSTDVGWPAPGVLESAERALRDLYTRLSYAWLGQPLLAAGQLCGWMVLARPGEQIGPAAQQAAEQLAPLVALRLREDQAQQALARSQRHSALLEQRLHTNDSLMLYATLAAGTAHDLGNLFTSLLAHSQLLQQDAPDYLQNDVAVLMRAAEDGRQLLRRLQTGVLQPEPQAGMLASPPAVIEEALELTRPLWDAHHNIKVATQLAEVPPVRARPADLREVLVNLIINAIAAMAAGGTITLGCVASGDRVVISVADDGAGVPYEKQSVIFQPLATTRAHGSGLGLSISRALLELYDGTISLESVPGQGATFYVTLLAAERDRAVSQR